MAERQSPGWLPNVIGVAALLLAVDTMRQLAGFPPQHAEAFLFGRAIHGWLAYGTSIVIMLFFAWVSAAAFRRRALTVWLVVGYCLYTISSVWIWLAHDAPQTVQTRLITGGLTTVLLLAICRIVIERRMQFDQEE